MIERERTAFVFPGQGSQMIGMSRDIADAYPAAREVFERADAILGYSLSRIIFEGSEEALGETQITQPALFTAGIATLRALESELPDFKPSCAAGHSLGEFTALAAAGAISFEDGLRLVAERGRLMTLAGITSPGAMAALIGLHVAAAGEVCDRAATKTGGVLVVANDNCPGQVVVSGDQATLEAGLALAKEAGARRSVKLAVSIAAHSPLMMPAAKAFHETLAQTHFNLPNYPVYGNVDALPLRDVGSVRLELSRQLTQSVQWTRSVQAMIRAGVDTFVELGGKEALTGLLRRIDAGAAGYSLHNKESLHIFVQSALSVS